IICDHPRGFSNPSSSDTCPYPCPLLCPSSPAFRTWLYFPRPICSKQPPWRRPSSRQERYSFQRLTFLTPNLNFSPRTSCPSPLFPLDQNFVPAFERLFQVCLFLERSKQPGARMLRSPEPLNHSFSSRSQISCAFLRSFSILGEDRHF